MLGDDRSDYIQTPRCPSDVPPLQYSLNAHHNHQYLLDQGSLYWMMYIYGSGNWTLRAENIYIAGMYGTNFTAFSACGHEYSGWSKLVTSKQKLQFSYLVAAA